MSYLVRLFFKILVLDLFIAAALLAPIIAAHWSTVLWLLGLAK